MRPDCAVSVSHVLHNPITSLKMIPNKERTLDISILRRNIFSSTFSRAETTLTQTMSFFGPTEVSLQNYLSRLQRLNHLATGPGCSSSMGLFMELGSRSLIIN